MPHHIFSFFPIPIAADVDPGGPHGQVRADQHGADAVDLLVHRHGAGMELNSL